VENLTKYLENNYWEVVGKKFAFWIFRNSTDFFLAKSRNRSVNLKELETW